MRMVYTESLFLFLILLTFVAMDRKWPLAVIGVIAGAATATRSVGVVLLLPFAWHVWEREKEGGSVGALTPSPSPASGRGTALTPSPSPKRRGEENGGTALRLSHPTILSPLFRACVRLGWLAPLATWGLLAYIVFQWWAFNEPFAFVKTQQFWSRRPTEPFWDTIVALLAWEPVWSVYTPGLPGYWGDIDRGVWMPFSFQLANANLFLLAIALVALGAAKKWLSVREVIFAAALIGIPYAMSGFRFCMGSQGRFVSVVFPIYLVLGHILCRLPVAASVALLVLSAAYLALFSAMLAAGYGVY